MTDEKTCVHNMCNHEDRLHINGNCYAITEEEKIGPERFCKCGSQNGQNLRLMEDLGYMPEAETDMLTTRKCLTCDSVVLLRRDEDMCQFCRPEHPEPKTKTPEYHIRKPLSQQELQKLL